MSTPPSFGPYPILRKVNQGEFSQIFAVQKDGREVALKKLKTYLKYDYEYSILIDNEAALLGRVQDPDHFPQFFGHGEIDHEHYLLLELLDGVDLGKFNRLDAGDSALLPLPLVGRIVLEMARGLKSLHDTLTPESQPSVHADLRPSNVMVTRQGGVKLIDLGLKGGTFIYMPLSRMHSREIDPYTDIYAWGHILYELTHGEQLFKAKDKLGTYFEMRDKKITPDLFADRLPDAMRRLLSEILQQETAPRYTAMAPLIEDLEKILAEENLLGSPEELGTWVEKIQPTKSA